MHRWGKCHYEDDCADLGHRRVTASVMTGAPSYTKHLPCARHCAKELLNLHDNPVRKGLPLFGQMRKQAPRGPRSNGEGVTRLGSGLQLQISKPRPVRGTSEA